MSYQGPIRAGGLSVGTPILGLLQRLVISWSYLAGALSTGGSFAEFESPENLANVKKDCP